MKTKQAKVLMSFKKNQETLESTTRSVETHLYEVPLYNVDPPVSKTDLSTTFQLWLDGIVTSKQGGTVAPARKNAIQQELTDMVSRLAAYVQFKSQGVLADLLASGFLCASENTASTPLAKPASIVVDNSMTGKIVLKTPPIRNARCFRVQYAVVDESGTVGPWQEGNLQQKSREIAITGLVSGVLYAMRICAVGGSTGESEWSNVVSGRCM